MGKNFNGGQNGLSGISQEYFRHFLAIYGAYIKHFLVTFLRHISNSYRAYAGHSQLMLITLMLFPCFGAF